MPRIVQIVVIERPVTVRTLCATTAFFYDLLGRAQDLDRHRLAAERALELPSLRVRLAEVTGGNAILTGLHRRRRPRFGEPLPAANDTGRDVELAAQLGHRLLARYDSLDRRSLELCAEDASAVCLPPVFAHGASRCILRPHGEQAKRGALQPSPRPIAI